MIRAPFPILAALLLLAGCGKAAPTGPGPYQIHIVGSAATFPFSTAAAEAFLRGEATAIAPLVQAGGSADGFARFCGGLGRRHPDLVGATRAMSGAERAGCARNGIHAIAKIPLGSTAFVWVTRPDTPALPLTRADLARALTGDAATWAAVDPALPATPILIHGPAASVGDGLSGAILPAGGHLRTDGAYHPHGADAEIVAQQVAEHPGAIGLLPYAAALAHADTLRILPLDGVTPTPATIASRRYPASVPVILYAKANQIPAVPGLKALLARYAGIVSAGADGLVPLPAPQRRASLAALAQPAARPASSPASRL